MKFKNLLSLGAMLSCGLVAQAQVPVFHESFDAEQSKQPTDIGWYEEINKEEGDDWSLSADGFSGKCFNFFNNFDFPNTGNWWRRAVKFRNLPLEAGKSYRLTFRFKGSNIYSDAEGKDQKSQMKVGLMQGVENADISILGANDKDQYRIVSYFNDTDYEKYSLMYYFADKENQDAKYDANCSAKEEYNEANKNQYFATFNVFNSGEYYLDEVNLEEANIAGMKYHFDVVCVDLGYATNAASLAGAKGYYVLPNESATVKINGTEAVVEAVELRSDGKLYVFLVEAIEDNAEVEVSFTNPEGSGFEYAADAAIQGAVLNFAEKAEFDETFNPDEDITSWLYGEPVLESTTPIDGSFGLDGNVSEFTFTFDREVYSVANDVGEAPVAKLSDGTVLKLKEGTPETTKTLTFVREGADLADGSYSVTVDNVISAKGTEGKQASLAFEVGKIKFAETIYTDLVTSLVQGAANGQPVGWTIMVGGENWSGGTAKEDNGSACRNMISVGSDGKEYVAFYLCDRDGYTYMQYGDQEDARITLPAGNVEFSIMAIGHDGALNKYEYRLEDMDGNEVARSTGAPTMSDKNFTTLDEVGALSVRFNNPKEQNFILKVHAPAEWAAVRILGFKARSYVVTEGASTEAEVAFSDATFGGANGVSVADNATPAPGSGWAIYQASEDLSSNWKKEPGKDYNYNGVRIFNLGIKNLSAGWYTNGNWPLTYAIYGSQESEGENEPLLHLKSGRHQITYYASNWKENSANAGKDHIVYFELADKESETVIYERKDKIVKCDMNADRNANVTAEKIQFNVTIPEEGDYTIKFGGSTEQFIGNIKIEKLGSQTAYYLGMVNSARGLAMAEYELAEDATFDGTTKTALKAAIDKYADPSFLHTPAEATAAKAELEELTKEMETRREYVARYDKALEAALAILEEVGEKEATEDDPGHEATKYANLEAFSQLTETYQKYAETSSLQLEDAELMSATTDLENKTTWLRNMKDKCIALLTKQVVDAAATLVKLDESLVDDEQVIAAGNALTDDQKLANMLNLRITKTIYDKLAAGDNPFSIIDEDIMEEVADSIDLSSFIQNANLYTTETDVNKNLTDIKNLPGWNIDVISGTPSVEWGWVAFNANEYNPVNDQFLVCGWYTEWNLYQTVKNLPVGKYTYVSSTQDRGFDDTSDEKNAYAAEHETWHVTGNKDGVETEGDILSYIWWQVGEQKDSVGYVIDNQGQWYGMTDCVSKQFDVPANVEGKTGEVTIGSHPKEFQGAASADNFRLYMVGKAEGFDYAAAAKKLADDVAASIENAPAAPEGAPASVVYYDLSGRQVAQPQGVAIKVEKWANGYTKISKVVIK